MNGPVRAHREGTALAPPLTEGRVVMATPSLTHRAIAALAYFR